ncbi:TPA: hypothetical protein QCR55_005231 [Bacillus cereus]|nr:hypothetical protein [Bacillus cereus]HDR4880264.1 hypothetical protein [Bacillus cereus]
MESLRRFAKAALYYCNRNNKWDVDMHSDKPLKTLLEKIYEHPRFSAIFEVEIAESIINSYLEDIHIQQQTNYGDQDADQFLEYIYENLYINIKERWIIFPLKGAFLSKTVKYKDFIFISGDRNEKLNTLKKIFKVSLNETKTRMQHIERKSSSFLQHPLVAIRVKHQYSYVFYRARHIGLYTNSILHAIYWGNVYPKYKLPLFSNIHQNEHINILLTCGTTEYEFNNAPLNFNANCFINLDWLLEKKYIKLLDLIYQEMVMKTHNPVSQKFLNGINFFKRAIEVENSNDITQGLGTPLLLLTIASENILLKHKDSKRDRLRVLFPCLVNWDVMDKNEFSSLISQIYTWRSEFVHAGIELYKDYNEDFSSGPNTKQYINFKVAVSKLLCRSPYFIRLVNNRFVKQDSIRHIDLWNTYLDNHWNRGKSLLNKVE